MKSKTRLVQLLLACSVLFAKQIVLAADSGDLLAIFWQAETTTQLQNSREQLINEAGDADTLYQWLRAGPNYSADVPKGQQESARVTADGTRFPYVFLIPETYNPATSYPVEFILHGGVSRPEWEAGGGWWRRGYDSLKQEDRIIVVPASWIDAFWWHENQAESLPEILKTLKRTYNIDDNRVSLSGVSDGGTGVYFFAFKQPTPWSVFLPYIGHPGVLRNPQSGGGYSLYFENLMNKPLYIVNGENDRLYPVSAVQPFIDILDEVGVNHIFKAITGGGHNTDWLPDEKPMIEKFKLANPRDAFPENVQWVADRTDKYNRNLWIRVDGLDSTNNQGLMQVTRRGNLIEVTARGVTEFTLLLNPEEVDFSREVEVRVNSKEVFNARVSQSMETLLDWAAEDLDKSMLYTVELPINSY